MSRRKSTGDQEFGSDSFLDIIANIVGILIILIVMAGVKVARQPALLADPEPEAVSAELNDSPVPGFAEANGDLLQHEGSNHGQGLSSERREPTKSAALESVDADAVQTDTGQTKEVQSAIASLTEPAVEVDTDAELEQQIAALRIQLNESRSDTATTENELSNLLALIQQQQNAKELQQRRAGSVEQERTHLTHTVLSLQASLSDIERQAASFRSTAASLTERQAYIAGALQQVAAETQQLQEVLDAVEAQQPNSDRLNHRLSPVSESVAEDELHFRLHGGRIAHVPLKGLLERMREQVVGRRNMVMRFHRYEGMVGPVGGFQMKYIVQRDSHSPLQSLQMGQELRITVARWSILPSDTLNAEKVDTALRIGSRFRQLLESTDSRTTITIWLYPDDFRYFSRLRELAHSLNLRVAARPLPEGTDISASPTGSRSTAQ